MFVDNLRTEIDEFFARITRDARLWKMAEQGAVTPRIVALYLCSLRPLLDATVADLPLARDRASELGLGGLSDYFAAKIPEESGHSLWAEEDLAALRMAFGVEGPLEPKPAMKRLIQFLETTARETPAAYLGYATFTEYFTVIAGPAWVRMLVERCGISTSMLSVVTHHVELDVAHAARGFEELARLMRDEDQDAVLATVRTAMRCLEDFYDELANDGSSGQRQVA